MEELHLFAKSFGGSTSHSAPMHQHAHGHFIWLDHGLIEIQTPRRVWLVPEGQLLWVPPYLPHGSQSRGIVSGWVIDVGQSVARYLPAWPSMLRASELLVSALHRAARGPASNDGLNDCIGRLVSLEIQTVAPEEVPCPLPLSVALRSWSWDFLEKPDAGVSIAAAADATGMSARSFTRHFAVETGQSFASWKRRVIVLRAIDALKRGSDVGTIAERMGYESIGAFSTMFRATTGRSPTQFWPS